MERNKFESLAKTIFLITMFRIMVLLMIMLLIKLGIAANDNQSPYAFVFSFVSGLIFSLYINFEKANFPERY